MRWTLALLLLTGCYPHPPVNHQQCDWRHILCDPLMNELMDYTTLSSSSVATTYTQLRGLQLRQAHLEIHIAHQEELICLTNDLVDRGLASSIDLQTLITSLGTLKGDYCQLQTNVDKLFYQLAFLVKMEPKDLAPILSTPCASLPVAIRSNPPCGRTCLEVLSYYNNEERVAALKAAKEAGLAAYEMTEDLFKRGLKSSSELLTAHRALIAAEDDLIRAEVDLLSDYITLYDKI